MRTISQGVKWAGPAAPLDYAVDAVVVQSGPSRLRLPHHEPMPADQHHERMPATPPVGRPSETRRMASILITAFEPYDRWSANSSWLALVQLTQDLRQLKDVTTRLYPVDFAAVKEKLANDLKAGHDYALHLGQAPGSTRIQLESIGINVGGSSSQAPEQFCPLVEGGPIAYRSPLPLGSWAAQLRGEGIPAQVSYHAGTYLCNATLYFSCYLAERMGLSTQAAFIHLPLAPVQTAAQAYDLASLPVETSVEALKWILDELVRCHGA
jgi:pyroglutamyl-peptidase